MKASLIRMFQCEVPAKGIHVDYKLISKRAIESGYLVEPEAATQDVLNFLEEQYINPNATFFKSWDDIVYNNQSTLAIEALKHYLSTYGSANPEEAKRATLVAGNSTVQVSYNVSGNGYVPNSDYIVIPLNTFKIIKAVTPEYVRDRILQMLKSGIAMNLKTLNDCIDFLQQFNFLDDLNVNEIKNKEAQALICCELKKFPDDEFGLLRCIVYDCTGTTMLIKSPEMIRDLSNEFGTQLESINLEILTNTQLKKLSRIFYRYKPLFLALKKRRYTNKAVINKIRRYAKENHTPLKKGFWEDILHNPADVSEVLEEAANKVNGINNFKKVQLMQAIRARLVGANIPSKVYTIRNGKSFIKTGDQSCINFDYLNSLYNILKNSLIESLKKKATTFTIPEALHLTCPTSEKNFLGNYPIGTWVDFAKKDNVLGIYWRNEWGARDLDLHVVRENGGMIGWNSMYKSVDQDVVYSGDMTNADPEASELVYFKKQPMDCYVNINLFNGSKDSKYRLFVAKENVVSKLKELRRDTYRRSGICMCDPNNIIMEAMMTFNGDGENRIGYIHNNKLHLMSVKSGNSRVTKSEYKTAICDSNKVLADSFIELIPLLEEAGFKRVSSDKTLQEKTAVRKDIDVTGLSKEEAIKKVEEAYNEPMEQVQENAELDFANIDKDTLINLFA